MSSSECNVEDILCQIKALESLRSLRTVLGNEAFISEFPELETLEPRLLDKIQTTEGDLKKALAKCGNIPEEETVEETQEE